MSNKYDKKIWPITFVYVSIKEIVLELQAITAREKTINKFIDNNLEMSAPLGDSTAALLNNVSEYKTELQRFYTQKKRRLEFFLQCSLAKEDD